MERKQVRLDKIIVDTTLQVRKEVNGFYVSKYTQVLKSGNDFDDCIVLLPDMRLVSGFTRYEAYKRVFDPTSFITVEFYPAKDETDAYLFAAKANLTHGQPLAEFEKNAIRRNLQDCGWTDEGISKFLGISLDRFNKWDSQLVKVKSSSDGEVREKPTKPMARMPGEITEKQYESHMEHHGANVSFHIKQVLLRIQDGTIQEDEKTIKLLEELKDEIEAKLESL